MNADDRVRLQRLLASFDEAGLIALANKGLVRRAQKELEAGAPSVEETDAALLVRGPGWTVTMPPDGPTKATDDTRATGVTWKVIAATIHLRDHWAPADAATAVAVAPAGVSASRKKKPSASATDAAALEQALLGVSLDDLQKWAGKNLLRETFPLLKRGLVAEVETHAGLTIRLVGQDVEARLLPGKRGKSASALLDEMLTTASKSQHRRWVVAAVLAFQQARGKALALPDETTIEAEADGTPLTRARVLASACELLAGMTTTGLAHPSERMVERLFTLSVSAVAVHLPRLARLLRALSDDVSLVLARDAAADTGRLFDRASFALALARALAAAGPTPTAALAGRHRTQYDPAGDLDLAGVGAFPWQTASGFEGVTVLFWDVKDRRFLTWTASRPSDGPGRFDPTHAYRHEAAWDGGGSPSRLSRSRLTLCQARVNPIGRLSSAQGARVSNLASTDPAQLDFGGRLFTSWQALRGHALTTYPIGLIEKAPLDRIVVLQPTHWGERVFDELQQRFVWPLLDAQGDAIALTLPWAGVNEAAIQFLEAVNPERDRLTRVVTRISFTDAGMVLEPLALHGAGTPAGHVILNPGFDQDLVVSKHSTLLDKLRAKYGRDRIATTMTADDEADEAESAALLAGAPPALGARLAEAEGLLVQLAESGLRRLNDAQQARVKQLAAALDRSGLGELSQALGALADSPDASRVLWAGYLCRLHRQAIGARLGAATSMTAPS